MIPSNEPPEARVPGIEERARREVTERVAVRYEKVDYLVIDTMQDGELTYA